MDVYFGSVHLQTLCDLEQLANKHNCFIHFGVNQHNSEDVDIESDLIKQLSCKKNPASMVVI